MLLESCVPRAVAQALAALRVDHAAARRTDGHLSFRVRRCGRIDLHINASGGVVITGTLSRFSNGQRSRSEAIDHALRISAPRFGRFQPTIAVSTDRVLLQCAVPSSALSSFGEILARFINELARRRRLGVEHDEPPRTSTAWHGLGHLHVLP